MMSSNQALHDLLQMERFRHWLEQHDDDDIVGFIADPCHCPVAAYLRDHGHDAIIGAESLSQPGRLSQVDAPNWLERFIYHVDDTTDHDEDGITARRAIICMNIVRSEMMRKACADRVEEYARMDGTADD